MKETAPGYSMFTALYLSGKQWLAKKPLWQEAIENCDLNLAKQLISQYNDANALHKLKSYAPGKGEYKYSLLSYALELFSIKKYKPEFFEMIELLLDNGADPNLSNTLDGKPYGTAISRFITNGLPDIGHWQEKDWLSIVELLIKRRADLNAEYDTEAYKKGNDKSIQAPPIRTLLVDIVNASPFADIPERYNRLVGLLVRYKADINKAVNGKTALDYALNKYFENFRPVKADLYREIVDPATQLMLQWKSLWHEISVWLIGELIAAGADVVHDGRLSLGDDHTKREVPVEFVTEVFRTKATQCSANNGSDLVRQMQAIFNLTADEASVLTANLIIEANSSNRVSNRSHNLRHASL